MTFLTIDVDWAQDERIDALAGVLRHHRVPATWFITHASPAVDRLREHPELFELGIHPNFDPGSTQGSTVDEVLDHVLALVPGAVSTRTHRTVWFGRLAGALAARGLRLDSSAFLPDAHWARPVRHETPAGLLLRVPFLWCDDYERERARPDWDLVSRFGAGDGVVLFHPVHQDGPAGPALEALAAHLGRTRRGRRLRDLLD